MRNMTPHIDSFDQYVTCFDFWKRNDSKCADSGFGNLRKSFVESVHLIANFEAVEQGWTNDRHGDFL